MPTGCGDISDFSQTLVGQLIHGLYFFMFRVDTGERNVEESMCLSFYNLKTL